MDFANGKCQYNAETKLSKALLASIVHFEQSDDAREFGRPAFSTPALKLAFET